MSPSGSVGTPARPPFADRLVLRAQGVAPAGWRRLDVVVATASFVGLTLPALLGYPSHGGSPAGVLLFGAGATLPVAVRRRWPLPVLGAVTVATAIGTMAGVRFTPFASNAGPGVALAMYTVAERVGRRASVAALAATFATSWASVEVAAAAHAEQDHNAVHAVAALAAWAAGDAVQARRRYRAQLAAHRRQEAEERARPGLAEQRLRISREMHDVLSHGLSVIAVQAGVGRLVFDDRPDEARAALGRVETLSRSAPTELRRILDDIRQGDTDTDGEAAPTPALRDLPELVERIAGTGADVTLDLVLDADVEAGRGLQRPMSELCAYRIAQEALTNVIRHAPGATARVAGHQTPTCLLVEVVDDGRPGPPAVGDFTAGGAGWGIAGMRERAALFGGSVVAEPRREGGFRVAARLPTERSEREPAGVSEP